MVFIRVIKGKKYYYTTKRVNGKVKQIFLGAVEPETIKTWYIPEWREEKWKNIGRLRKELGLPPLKLIQEFIEYDFKNWQRKLKRKELIF